MRTPTLPSFAAPRRGAQCPSGGRAGTEMNAPPPTSWVRLQPDAPCRLNAAPQGER